MTKELFNYLLSENAQVEEQKVIEKASQLFSLLKGHRELFQQFPSLLFEHRNVTKSFH